MKKMNELKAIEAAIETLKESYNFLIKFDGGYSEELSWDVERAFLSALHVFKEANVSKNYSFIKRLQEAADGYHQTEEYAAWGTGELYDIIVELKKYMTRKRNFLKKNFQRFLNGKSYTKHRVTMRMDIIKPGSYMEPGMILNIAN